MGTVNLDQILITPLKRIEVQGGDVLHGLKKNDAGFKNFGEAYFSFVERDVVKAWKMHQQMTLNLIVPVGNVRFVFVSESGIERREEIIGETNYARLTVPPKVWFGFQGLGSSNNIVLNIADILHDPNEVERMDTQTFKQKYNQEI